MTRIIATGHECRFGAQVDKVTICLKASDIDLPSVEV